MPNMHTILLWFLTLPRLSGDIGCLICHMCACTRGHIQLVVAYDRELVHSCVKPQPKPMSMNFHVPIQTIVILYVLVFHAYHPGAHYSRYFADITTIMSRPVQLFFMAFFWSISLTTAVVECAHARNRQLLHYLNSFAIFSGMCMIADGMQLLRDSLSMAPKKQGGPRHKENVTVDKDKFYKGGKKQKEVIISGFH